LATLLVVIAAFVANLPALREQWRTDRPGSIKTSGCSASTFSISAASEGSAEVAQVSAARASASPRSIIRAPAPTPIATEACSRTRRSR
jgi:hypothetical protein